MKRKKVHTSINSYCQREQILPHPLERHNIYSVEGPPQEAPGSVFHHISLPIQWQFPKAISGRALQWKSRDSTSKHHESDSEGYRLTMDVFSEVSSQRFSCEVLHPCHQAHCSDSEGQNLSCNITNIADAPFTSTFIPSNGKKEKRKSQVILPLTKHFEWYLRHSFFHFTGSSSKGSILWQGLWDGKHDHGTFHYLTLQLSEDSQK